MVELCHPTHSLFLLLFLFLVLAILLVFLVLGKVPIEVIIQTSMCNIEVTSLHPVRVELSIQVLNLSGWILWQWLSISLVSSFLVASTSWSLTSPVSWLASLR
jgi:hypothetical protein